MNVDSLIGQYRIVRTLGAGGMGTVYLGEHILLGRRAAIKTLLPSLSSHREIVDRFFNEARAISTISDPGVVQIFDFGFHVDGTAYIVMEFLDGESLSQRLDRVANLPVAEALRITRQIAASLRAAHARGIVHRDLKPGNVFLIRDRDAHGGERTKILDFGIAKLVSSPVDLVTTQTGMMLGTPIYMSPEQCRGGGTIDHRSDIYAVGAALFHMLTGVPPFDCDTVGDCIAAHLKDEPPRPSDLAHELPPPVDALVLRCLAKAPKDRYQSMAELAAACEHILATLSDPRLAPDAPDEHSPRGTPPPFADSEAHGALVDDELEWSEPERGLSTLQHVALVGALFVGLLGGIAIIGYLMGDRGSARAASVTASPRKGAPVVTTAHEVAPSEPGAGSDALAPKRAPDGGPDAGPDAEPDAEPAGAADHVVPKAEAAPAPVATPQPGRPRPARAQQRPRPRRVPPPAPAPTSSQEDLYETR